MEADCWGVKGVERWEGAVVVVKRREGGGGEGSECKGRRGKQDRGGGGLRRTGWTRCSEEEASKGAQ